MEKCPNDPLGYHTMVFEDDLDSEICVSCGWRRTMWESMFRGCDDVEEKDRE